MNEKQIAYAIEMIVNDCLPFSHATRPMRAREITERMTRIYPHFEESFQIVKKEAIGKLSEGDAPDMSDEPEYYSGLMKPSLFYS